MIKEGLNFINKKNEIGILGGAVGLFVFVNNSLESLSMSNKDLY